jgi:RNA polymerase sigma-70 factor, ECF subfamily
MLSEADKYLITRIQEGDYHAFEILFNGYYAELCRFAKSFTHSVNVAEDLVSDLFMRIWEQPHVLAASVSLRAYLRRSICNSCINYLHRQHLKFGLHDTATIDQLNELLPDPEDSPYGIVLLEELEDKIDRAIHQLPAECARIFILSRKEQLSHQEIAEKLHISENTVKVQIYRALTKLREALKDYL